MALPDILRQLATMSPAIGAGLSGNGDAMKAFMDGYQRTMQQIEAQQGQGQDRQMAMEDRQRLITRQTEQDRIAAEQRQRQQALQVPQIGQSLAQAGGMSETPEGSEQAIDALFRIMAPSLGGVEQLGGVRDTAMLQAGRTITARQKKDVERFVDQALKTSFIADNPEADPEITNLPEHIQKIVGKPSAKLSELQTYAQMPVGKPAAAKGAAFNLSPGQVRFDSDGKPIAGLPSKPEAGGKTTNRFLKDAHGNILEWPTDQPAPRGAKPYDPVAERQTSDTGPSAYSLERETRTLQSVDELLKK